jgi:hypothetical protein
MNDNVRYEVVPSRVWLRDDGAKASIHGAVPWASDEECRRWRMVQNGWTVYNPLTGQYGVGRPPCATRQEAEVLAVQLGRPSNIGMGY